MAMGTRLEVSVTAQASDDAWRGSEAAVQAVEEVEGRLSTWREDSDVSRINRAGIGRWVEVSPKTVKDLSSAVSWSRITGGAFHPGMGALVGAWLRLDMGRLPKTHEIEELWAATSLESLQVECERVRRMHRLFRLDTGAFGKGVALREAAGAALEAGATCVDLNFGGQLMRAGRCGDVRVSIADPRDRWSGVTACRLVTGSLATSGNSQRGITVGTDRIGHIIDPRTGSPSRFEGSVTVVASDPVAADSLSTALFVMGPEAGRAWIRSHPTLDVHALWVSGDGEVLWATPGFPESTIQMGGN